MAKVYKECKECQGTFGTHKPDVHEHCYECRQRISQRKKPVKE